MLPDPMFQERTDPLAMAWIRASKFAPRLCAGKKRFCKEFLANHCSMGFCNGAVGRQVEQPGARSSSIDYLTRFICSLMTINTILAANG